MQSQFSPKCAKRGREILEKILYAEVTWRKCIPLMSNTDIQRASSWRDYFLTEEVADAAPLAGDLFRRRFGHDIPTYPRHFILKYSSPPPDSAPDRVLAYVHQMPFKEIYLGGGMCVDESAYRAFPKWLFTQVRNEGGLATIVTRDSLAMLGDSPAAFGHVGEPRARQADLRTGYVETGVPHLMVYWRRDLSPEEKQRLISLAQAFGPF